MVTLRELSQRCENAVAILHQVGEDLHQIDIPDFERMRLVNFVDQGLVNASFAGNRALNLHKELRPAA